MFSKKIFPLAFVSVVACGNPALTSSSNANSDALSLAIDCVVGDGGCPAGYECETETEHGATTTACRSHGEAETGVPNGTCPAGFEVEEEHGATECKREDGSRRPHTEDEDNRGRGNARDGVSGVSGEAGVSGSTDDASDDCDEDSDDDHGGASGVSGVTGTTGACSSDADCGPGLECEFEHGASFCKAHGGSGKGK